MPRRSLSYTLARVAEVTPPPLIPRFQLSGIDPRLASESTHLSFDLVERLHEALALDDPSLPFTGNPLPDERYLAGEVTIVPPASDRPVRVVVPAQQKSHERARMARLRKQRHLRLLEAILQLRVERLSPSNVVRVPEPGDFDFSVIEDRDYALGEVVGPDSRFHLRRTHWSGKDVRVIASERRAVTLLAGSAQGYDWSSDIIKPVTAQLDEEAAALRARNGPDHPLVMSVGVGTYFNECKASETPLVPLPREIGDRAQDALASMSLLSSIPMKRLVSFSNGIFETYCVKSARLLKAQKRELLAHDPQAHFPCETSDFSAFTFELGGPHRRMNHRGLPYTYEPGSWIIITALGDYDPTYGGMIILYSMIQWAGSGIRRFFENGNMDDTTFAVSATEEEHAARELLRREAHLAAIGAFPRAATLPTGKVEFPYNGVNPLY
ncbi:hypothetical protein R3P38DRAFT_2776753 [Favolaschia claudopus]|uniref:Uncharacterized protein n=1 Tax=Favolaschia claudopus TaxID=2862362 RepID=A0AAW0BNK4_9AGAR